MTVVLNGKKLADDICENLKAQTLKLPKKPKLAVIVVGNINAVVIVVVCRFACNAERRII